MFIPNAPAADYEYRAKLGDIFTRTRTSVGMYRRIATVVRIGSADTGTWITIACDDGVDPGDPNASAENKYILDTPWGDVTTTPIAGWDSAMECRLQIDAAKVTTSDCDEFSFEFDEIRFYVHDGDEFVLTHTIAGGTYNYAFGFDRRYCTVAHTALVYFNPTKIIGSDNPDCDQVAFENSSVSNDNVPCVGGWRKNGEGQPVVTDYDAVTIPPPVDHEGCPTDLDCETRVAMQGFYVDPIEQSWNIEYYPAIKWLLEYGTEQEILCSCTRGGIPCGIPWIWRFVDRSEEFYTYTSEIWSAPTYAGIFDHTYRGASNRWCCNLSPIPEETVETYSTTQQTTYAATWETLEGTWSDVSCYELIQNGACCPPTEEDPVDPPESPCYSEGVCCAYTASRRVTWGPVICGDSDPDLAVFYGTETYKAVHGFDGNLYCYGKIGSTAPWEFVGQITTNGAVDAGQHSLAITREKYLVINYSGET